MNGLDHRPAFSTGLAAKGRCRDLYFGIVGKHGRFLGTSQTYSWPRSSSPRRNSGLPPYHSSKVSQSKRTPLAIDRLTCPRASSHLGA